MVEKVYNNMKKEKPHYLKHLELNTVKRHPEDLSQHKLFILLTHYYPSTPDKKRQLIKFYVLPDSDMVAVCIEGEGALGNHPERKTIFNIHDMTLTKKIAKGLWNKSIAEGAIVIYPTEWW